MQAALPPAVSFGQQKPERVLRHRRDGCVLPGWGRQGRRLTGPDAIAGGRALNIGARLRPFPAGESLATRAGLRLACRERRRPTGVARAHLARIGIVAVTGPSDPPPGSVLPGMNRRARISSYQGDVICPVFG
jgi:hypothetical protein